MSSPLSFLAGVIRDLHVANYNAVAATALLIYEIIITLDQEFKYIWRSQWSIVKVLYLLVRYYAMIFMLMNSFVTTNGFLSQRFCHHFNHFQVWGAFVEPPMVDLLICIRIYALYGRSRRMGFVLATVWLVEFITCFTLLGFAWTPFESIANPLPGIVTGCVTNFTPKYSLTLAFWSVSCVSQAILVGLTLFKLRGLVRTSGLNLSSWSPLITVFFRDGAAYFAIILAAILLNALVERFGTILLIEAASFWAVAIPAIAACRLVLNIRDISAPPVVLTGSGQDMLTTDTELHNIRFNSKPDETAIWKA